MEVLPLLKFRNYFINSQGYVFKISQGREEIVNVKQSPKSKDVFVLIEGKRYNLLYLMIEHFLGELKATDRVKFKVSKNLRIDLGSIKITPAIGKTILSKENEALLYNYKCDAKANSANSRCKDKVTSVDVFRTLSMHSFSCVYCGLELSPSHWHLDHFESISKGGLNCLENIVPSCGICNTMKGAMHGDQFYNMCVLISKKYLFKKSIEDLKENNKYISKLKNYMLKNKPQTTAV